MTNSIEFAKNSKSGDEYTAVASPTKSGLANYYELKGTGKDLNFMVIEKSAIIKYAKHVASRVFSPDELESLDSYMLKYRRYAICSVLENKLDGVYVSESSFRHVRAHRQHSSLSRATRPHEQRNKRRVVSFAPKSCSHLLSQLLSPSHVGRHFSEYRREGITIHLIHDAPSVSKVCIC